MAFNSFGGFKNSGEILHGQDNYLRIRIRQGESINVHMGRLSLSVWFRRSCQFVDMVCNRLFNDEV